MANRLQRTGSALAAGVLAGALAGVVDAAWTAARGPWAWGFLAVASGMIGLCGALVALPLVGAARLSGRLWAGLGVRRPGRAWAVAGLWGSLVLGGSLLGLGLAVFERETPPGRLNQFAWASVATLGVAAAVTRALAAGLERWPRLVVPAVVVPGVAAVAVTVGLGGVVEEVDARFVWVVLAYAAGLAWWWWRGVRRPWWVVLWALGLAALGLTVLVTQPAVRLAAARYSPVTGHVTRVVARLGDLDGDGFSLFGGAGDCGPFDGSVHPYAVDVPGDGVDQDCHAGDLDPGVLPAESGPAAAPAVQRRPNVVFVSVETLRADHMGFLGYARPTTPRLDAWVAGGAVFERAYTVAPVTDRVMPAWLGGMYPSMYVEALDYATHVMGAERELLPERLQAAGYHTLVLHSYHLFDDHGLGQGIDELVILGKKATQDARWTTNATLTRVREQLAAAPDQPLFVWAHYYEPHSRYEPPPAHALWGEAPIDRYDGEIHYVDEQVGELLEGLEQLGVLQDAYVIFAADHGEEFLEHGRRMHAYAVYEESVRVPWVIRGPDVVARRISAPVTTLDLTPTLLGLLDIPPIPGAEGISQAAALRGGAVIERPFFIEQWRHGTDQIQKIAVIDGSEKVILDLENQLWERYDLLRDPGERVNLDLGEGGRLHGLILDHRARSQAVRWRREGAR